MSWTTKRIDELGKVVTGTTPATANPSFYRGDFMFVTPTDLEYENYYVRDTYSTVTNEARDSFKNQFIPKNSIIFTCIGNTIGKCGISSDDCLTNQQINSIIVDGKNNPKFLYYLLIKNRFFIRSIGLSGGAAKPIINKSTFSSIKVRVPDKQTQDNIADILSAYDDLIENNRRRIQLLEQAARLLYKEWFVHLRFPGHQHTKIIDGVPESWEYKQVKDILEKVNRPRKIKKEDFLEDGLIPCIDQSRDFIGGYTDDEEAVVDIGQSVIIFGDHTRILKFIDFPFACGADGTQLIVSNDKAISQEFLYFALDAINLSNYFYARHFKFLKEQYIPRPIEILTVQFTEHVRPVMQQIKSLRDYSHHLTQARDLLLPKLMSGEVAV